MSDEIEIKEINIVEGDSSKLQVPNVFFVYSFELFFDRSRFLNAGKSCRQMITFRLRTKHYDEMVNIWPDWFQDDAVIFEVNGSSVRMPTRRQWFDYTSPQRNWFYWGFSEINTGIRVSLLVHDLTFSLIIPFAPFIYFCEGELDFSESSDIYNNLGILSEDA